MEPWEYLAEMERRIITAVPQVCPPACNWLESDTGPSFCRQHAWEARWQQMPTIGPCPDEPDWFLKNEFERLLAQGIGYYAIGVPGESDTPECCEICGCTLEYLLTDYGVDEELSHFVGNPIRPGDQIDGECTYVLTRIFMNLCCPSADLKKVNVAVQIASDALSAISSTRAA